MTTRIRLTNAFPEWPLLRQTPEGSGVWGDCRFDVTGSEPECDWWVVVEDLPCAAQALCPPEKTLFITQEPPTIRSYRADFLAQFARVVTCRRNDLEHPNVLVRQQGQPWHIGISRESVTPVVRFGYDDFRSPPPSKTKLLSVLCSNKAMTEGHRRRIAFVQRLQAHFGERLDVFGRGFREVADKWDAIAPYKYHLALENCAVADYWTEKLADTYLGGAFPFYGGCPNIADYFPADSLLPIDTEDVERTIFLIENALREERFERAQAALEAARTQVLDRYNLFALIAELCPAPTTRTEKQPIYLRPHAAFVPKPNLLDRIGRILRG